MDHFNTSSYSWISNSTQQTLSIQFQCNNAPIVCILTTSRTIEEYRMSDLGFQRSYSLDPTAIDVSFAPISALPGNETSALFFHARSSQMNLQKRNNSGFTTQISSIPYTLSLPYGIPRADMAVSTTGGVFTSVTTALNASFGLGQTEILLSYFRPSVDLKSTLIFTTVAQDNMSRIFVSGENSVVLTGLTEGVFISPNTVDSRQIFAVEFSYVEISVSTIIPNHVIATEVVQILFNQNLPSFVLSSLPKVTLGVMNCTDIQWNGSSLLARVPQGTGGLHDYFISLIR
ncbi:hypothetical protein BKA69DRAFT_690347 [Paraphysoderma sedebokerense]|nr:hypothetical protein BKA69DRAFT_690347 [Paraphysoderma sedebokerense]